MKRLKKSLYGLFAILALTLVGLSFILSFLDWNQYRDTLAAAASDRLGMRVDLAGKVTLSLVPVPSLSAEDIRMLPQGAAGSDALTAERIDLRISPLSLLGGKVQVERLDLEGVNLTLVESQAGTWGLKGAVKTPNTSSDTSSDTPAGSATLGVDRLRLKNSHITLQQYAKVPRTLTVQQLDFSGTLPTGPLDWSGRFVLNDTSFTNEGRMRPVHSRGEQSIRTVFTMDGGTVTISGRYRDVNDLTGRIEAEGENFDDFIRAASILFDGKSRLQGLPQKPFKVDMQADGKGQLLKVTSRIIEVAGTRGGVDLNVTHSDTPTITGAISLGILDAADWQEVTPVQTDTTQDTGSNYGIAGTVDMDVEGIQTQRGLIQKLGLSVFIQDTNIDVTRLQALLPGSTSVGAKGRYGKDGTFAGSYQVASGNVPTLLQWLGIKTFQNLPDGRLTTLSAEGALSLEKETWQIDVQAGQIDTTKISAEVRGSVGQIRPSTIQAELTDVNLEAYMPVQEKTDTASETEAIEDFLRSNLPGGDTMAIRVSASDMYFRGKTYDTFDFDGEITPAGITANTVQAVIGDSRVDGSGALLRRGQIFDARATLNAVNWSIPSLRQHLPDLDTAMTAMDIHALSGTVDMRGTLGELRLTAEVKGGTMLLETAGTLGIKGRGLDHYSLRGNFTHADLQPYLQQQGADVQGRLPVAVDFSLDKTARMQDARVRVNGNVSNAAIQLDGVVGGAGGTGGAYDLQVALDSKRVSTVAQHFQTIGFPEQEAPLALTAHISKNGAEQRLQDVRLQNGRFEATGTITHTAGQLAGAVTLSNLTINNRGFAQETGRPRGGDTAISFPWRDMDGGVDLNLQNIVVFGQVLNAPKVSAQLGGDTLKINLGEDARLNSRTIRGTVDLRAGIIPGFHLDVEAGQVDLPALFTASGFSDILTGEAQASFRLSGQGKTMQAMKSSLGGEGRVNGYAGRLKFLSVTSLQQDMTRFDSATAFIRSVGQHFRRGETQVAAFGAAFTIDSGVALFETLSAQGDWGDLGLDGQVNLADNSLSLSGQLQLTSPPDTPVIPVDYTGSLDKPQANWKSGLFERFVIAGIERRFRSRVFAELEEKQKDIEGGQQSPGAAVFGRAFDLLKKLQKSQKDGGTDPNQ